MIINSETKPGPEYIEITPELIRGLEKRYLSRKTFYKELKGLDTDSLSRVIYNDHDDQEIFDIIKYYRYLDNLVKENEELGKFIQELKYG